MDRPSAIYESEKQLKALADVLEGKEYKNTGATNGESKWLKYIVEQIEKNGVGGSSVQADWNQNDGAADDYIKNRPFYEAKQLVTFLDGTFEFTSNSGLYIARSMFEYDIIEGETYTITFDNVTYKCSAINLGEMGYGLGNLSIIGKGDDTGEPFAINVENYYCMIFTNTSEGNHSVSVLGNTITITKVPEKYLPTAIGIAGTGVHSEIFNSPMNVSSGNYSHAEGMSTEASGNYSHAEGQDTTASGSSSHSEGNMTTASNSFSHAEGQKTTASGEKSHAEGQETTASGGSSHAEGFKTTASGPQAHAEGLSTLASSRQQHVQGKYNIEDTNDSYAHIVGNGLSDTTRSNAHTIDWQGNAWFAGTVEGTAVILKSSTSGSSKRFKITVDDTGAIKATEITG